MQPLSNSSSTLSQDYLDPNPNAPTDFDTQQVALEELRAVIQQHVPSAGREALFHWLRQVGFACQGMPNQASFMQSAWHDPLYWIIVRQKNALEQELLDVLLLGIKQCVSDLSVSDCRELACLSQRDAAVCRQSAEQLSGLFPVTQSKHALAQAFSLAGQYFILVETEARRKCRMSLHRSPAFRQGKCAGGEHQQTRASSLLPKPDLAYRPQSGVRWYIKNPPSGVQEQQVQRGALSGIFGHSSRAPLMDNVQNPQMGYSSVRANDRDEPANRSLCGTCVLL